MKKCITEFLRRGTAACGIGPLILAVLYLTLRNRGMIEMLTVDQVCIGIFSLSALAFLAGGMNAIYQIERLPTMVAVLIHGCVLYVGYLITYLLNGWLELGMTPILVFSGIFVVGYLVIWGVIYLIISKKTQRLNEQLEHKRKTNP